MTEGNHARAERRILCLLSRAKAWIEPSSGDGTVLINAGERGVVAARKEMLDDLEERGLIVVDDDVVTITAAGRQHGGGTEAGQPSPIVSANREIELAEVAGPDGVIVVPVNLAESPLAMLARRRGRDGKPFLSEREWRAGERFRADYTRGQIMPRLGANWEAAVSAGRRSAGGGVAELTDAALAARFRVEKAIDSVGPELSGVLVDVCCFLKGLELVETERGWPVRSAKVVLKTALAALARHYNPETTRKPAHPLHWGAEGYRPKMWAGQ